MQKLGKEGEELIKSYEKKRLIAYLPTKDDKWTIGFGHTFGVKEGDVITDFEAEEFFIQDTKWAVDCVNDNVEIELTQNEFDALVSFVFNVGCRHFTASTLLLRLNAGRITDAIAEFARWNKQGHKILDGLTTRRAAEAKLFRGVT